MTPVLVPNHLVQAAGLASIEVLDGPASFEALDGPDRLDLIQRTADDRGRRIAHLDAELAKERAALSALAALADFLEPLSFEPLDSTPREVTHV